MKMLKYLLFTICILFVSCFGSIISFKDGSITEKDIQEKLDQALYRIKVQEYETKVRLAVELAMEKILKKEGAIHNKTKKQLVKEYVDKHFNTELKNLYEYNQEAIKKPFDEVRVELRNNYEKQIKNRLESKYYAELRNKYKISINLNKPKPPKADIDTKNEPFWGEKNSPVEIVEFSDYDCPYCQKLQTHIKKIKQEYGKKIKWVFKDFPLKRIHPQAMRAHIATNCAKDQNKFVSYHFAVFDAAQDGLTEEILINIAKTQRLNMAKFKKCLIDKTQEKAKEIDADIEEGSNIGVQGTPSLFVNGTLQDSFHTYEDMKDIIEEALEK